MKASVVIPTFNRPEAIITTIEALTKQTVRADKYEVIIVDDGSVEEHRADVEQYVKSLSGIDITFLCQGGNTGKAKAVNTGLRQAKYELVILTDDDCVPVEDWVASHIRMHEKIQAPASVFGPITLPEEWLSISNFTRYINSRYVGNRLKQPADGSPIVVPPNFFGGGNVSVPLDVLIRVGLFNEDIGRSQDIELGFRLWKANIPLIYSPTASIVHYAQAARDIDQWIAVLIKSYTFSVPQFQKLHPEAMSRFGHWFLEKPQPGNESLRRTMTKYLVRIVLQSKIANTLITIQKRTDGIKQFYMPFLFKYVIGSACLEAVKKRDRSLSEL